MVETNPAYVQDICYTAQDLRVAIANMVCSEGVSPTGDLKVTQSSPAAMTVLVACGGGFVKQESNADAPCDKEGYYSIFNDAPVTLTVAANSSGSTRTDYVWARVCDSQYAAVTSGFQLLIDQTSTGPAHTDGCSYMLLATITVTNGATTITDANIVDNRVVFAVCGKPVAFPIMAVYTVDSTFNKADLSGLGSGLRVRCVGGGGGGGGAENATAGKFAAGQGGGAGGFSERYLDLSDPGFASPVAITVGQGGTGGAAGANIGVDGTNSTFGSFITGGKGLGGDPSAGSVTSPDWGPGGSDNSGSATGGFLNIKGGSGGVAVGLSASHGLVPQGGASHLSPSSTPLAYGSTGLTGAAGKAYGGGGNGGVSVNATGAKAGGAGADGVVIVEVLF